MSINPYESPAALSPSAAYANQRPTPATVFGYLNIAFALLGGCAFAFTSILFFVPFDQATVEQSPGLKLMHENTVYRVVMFVAIPLGFAATIALLAGGIGLLMDRSFGRLLSLVYGYYAIAAGIIGLVLNITLFIPEMTKNLPEGPAGAAAMGGAIGGVFGSVVGMAYPVLLLYFMTRPNVVAFYNRKANRPASLSA